MVNKEKVENLMKTVEEQGLDSDKILDELTKKYSEQLDNTVKKIQTQLTELEGDLPIDDLIQCITELCPIIFFTMAGLEKLGNRADSAELIRVEAYNTARLGAVGNAADKQAYAESHSMDENVVSTIYSRAYKAVKARAEEAKSTVDALKKALSAKMAEMQLTRTQAAVQTSF